MPSRFPHLTLFIDAAGRYSHSKAVPIVFAGIVVETKAVNEIRESLLTAAAGHLYKWSNGVETQKCASTVFPSNCQETASLRRPHCVEKYAGVG